MNRLQRWFVKVVAKRELRKLGFSRKEVKQMLSFIGKIISLDIPVLVGIRTKLGILGLVTEGFVNMFANDALCMQFPKTCATVKLISTWLIAAGIYGKRP